MGCLFPKFKKKKPRVLRSGPSDETDGLLRHEVIPPPPIVYTETASTGRPQAAPALHRPVSIGKKVETDDTFPPPPPKKRPPRPSTVHLLRTTEPPPELVAPDDDDVQDRYATAPVGLTTGTEPAAQPPTNLPPPPKHKPPPRHRPKPPQHRPEPPKHAPRRPPSHMPPPPSNLPPQPSKGPSLQSNGPPPPPSNRPPAPPTKPPTPQSTKPPMTPSSAEPTANTAQANKRQVGPPHTVPSHRTSAPFEPVPAAALESHTTNHQSADTDDNPFRKLLKKTPAPKPAAEVQEGGDNELMQKLRARQDKMRKQQQESHE